MKTILASLLSSAVVSVFLAVYSVAENGLQVEILGLMGIAFLYALGVAAVVGIPVRMILRRLRKEQSIYCAVAGAVVGALFFVVPMVVTGHTDTSLIKTAAVLAVAGFVAGWTFHRVAN